MFREVSYPQSFALVHCTGIIQPIESLNVEKAGKQCQIATAALPGNQQTFVSK